MDKTLNVAAACFAGGAIGCLILVILGFGPLAVVLGTLASALIGFFTTDLARARRSAVSAWRASVPIVVSAVRRIPQETLATTRDILWIAWVAIARPIIHLLTLRPGMLLHAPVTTVVLWLVWQVDYPLWGFVFAGIITFWVVRLISNLVLEVVLQAFRSFKPKGVVNFKVFPKREELIGWCLAHVDATPFPLDEDETRHRLDLNVGDLHWRLLAGAYPSLAWKDEWRLFWGIYLRPLLSLPVVITVWWFRGVVFLATEFAQLVWDVTQALPGLALSIWKASLRFARLLFIGVHERYSRMALVDAPAGMLLTYALARGTMGSRLLEMSAPQQLLLVTLAGLVSLTIGVFNCRVVVPWLKTQPS